MEIENCLKIYFVQIFRHDKVDKRMTQAFRTCKQADLNPVWIDAEDVPDIPIRSNVVFVLRNFEGELFDSLATKECLVCGPRCIHTCVSMKLPVPENQSPIFTTPMRSFVVSTTKLPRVKKDEIKKMVMYMGGLYSDNLSMAVTHLIGNESRSEKCEKAGEMNIPVMRPSWIDSVWEQALTKDISGQDPVFDIHRLPAFQGMEISCSNLPTKVKKELKELIEANGGMYKSALIQNSTHRLIIGNAEGEKYKHAKLWGIPCVSPAWVHESIAKRIALCPANFAISDRPKCSTPTSELPSFMSNSDISAIPGVDTTRSEVDDTNSTVTSVVSGKHPLVRPEPRRMHPKQSSDAECKKYLDLLDLKEALQAGLFLDGCKIFLSGFSNQEVEKLKKVLNTGGATIFMQLSDRVTHVVSGRFVSSDAKAIAELQPRPHVVSLEWIVMSLKEKNPANVQPYLSLQSDRNAIPAQSPLSHKGLEMLRSNPETTPVNANTSDRPLSRKLFVKAQNKTKVLEAEPLNPEESCPDKEETGRQATPVQPQNAKPAQQGPPPQELSNFSEIDTLGPPTFFDGLVFEVSVPDPEETIKAIESAGGKVVSGSFHGVSDYAVVAIDERESHFSAPEIVTALWVEDCFEQNCVVKVEYYHQPLNFKQHSNPLEGTAICVSGYIGKERTFISFVATMLGSNIQELFSRNNHPDKGILKATHLLCNEPTGSKYKAAIKWGIPVVISKWLLDCALSGKLEPTESYFLLSGQIDGVTPLRSKLDDGCGSIAKNTPMSRLKEVPKGKEIAQFIVPPVPTQFADNGETPRVNHVAETPSTPSVSTSEIHPKTRNSNSSEKLTIMKRKLPSLSSRSSTSEISDNFEEDVFDFPNGSGRTKRRMSEKIIEQKVITPTAGRKLSIESTGPSPFHMDTPDSLYGQVFCDNTPSPNTRKKWKRYIDKFPDMHEDSPEPRARRKSTPLGVIKKQLLVKFGGADIEGIKPGSGELTVEGPFREWAKTGMSDLTTQGIEDGGHGNNERGNSKDSNNMKMGDTLDGIMSGVTPNSEKSVSRKGSLNKSGDPDSTKENEKPFDVDEDEEAAKLAADLRSQMPIYKRPSDLPGSSGVSRSKLSAEKAKDKSSYLERESVLDREDFHKFSGEESVTWDHERPKFLEKVMEKELRMKGITSKKPEETDLAGGNSTQPIICEESSDKQTETRIFTLSNINKNVKDKYESIIKSLGGEVSETKGYDEKSTHLIIEQLVRSEKLLCSMASGKWIIHVSYLDQCYESRMFLPEEDYEWGNPRGGSRLPELTAGSQEWLLARAAYKWRRNKTELGSNSSPFGNIKAVLFTPPTKTPQYSNLLLAGGATVLLKQKLLEATHCFVNDSKINLPVPLSELSKRNIHCLQPIFLGEVLTRTSISPSEFWTDAYRKVHRAKLQQPQ